MATKGKKQTQEHIQKRIIARLTTIKKNGWKFTDEWRKKLSEAKIGHKVSKETCKKISLGNIGKKRSEETKKKISLSQIGRKHSIKTRQKMSEIVKKRVTMGIHHFWKGGITNINIKIRRGLNYRLWRTSVFERDDYSCQFCKQRGGKLQADHIMPFALYPKLRFELSNGRTLCVPCHKKTETYLGKIQTYVKNQNRALTL